MNADEKLCEVMDEFKLFIDSLDKKLSWMEVSQLVLTRLKERLEPETVKEATLMVTAFLVGATYGGIVGTDLTMTRLEGVLEKTKGVKK